MRISSVPAVFLCLCMAGFLEAVPEENLVANPRIENVIETEEARKIIPEDEHRHRIQFYRLRPGELIPEDWRIYSGGGNGEWGATGKEAFTGEYSVYLTFKSLQRFDHGMFARMGLFTNFVEAEGGASYEFSFMIKGDIPVIRVGAISWSDEGMGRDSMSWIAPRGLRRNDAPLRIQPTGHYTHIAPTDEWTRFSFVVNTGDDSRVLQLRIMFFEEDQELEPGQTIYVDDARLTKRG